MVVTYWLRDAKDLTALATDPDWPAVTATEKDYGDLNHAQLVVGYETVYLQNGKIVNTTPTGP